MPSLNNPIQRFMSIWILFLGLLCAFLGLIGLITITDSIRYLFLLFAGSGIAMIIGAVGMWRTAQKAQSAELSDKSAVKNNNAQKKLLFLYEWKIAPNLWNRFVKNEIRFKITDIVIVSVIIVVLGFFYLIFKENAGVLIALSVGGVVALSYSVLRVYLFKKYLRKSSVDVFINITDRSLFVNNTYHVLNDNHYKLIAVSLRNERGLILIDFEISWETRGGVVSDNIRIPVPDDKFDEADEIVVKFENLFPLPSSTE